MSHDDPYAEHARLALQAMKIEEARHEGHADVWIGGAPHDLDEAEELTLAALYEHEVALEPARRPPLGAE